jgi:hypothetical protein
MAHPFPLFEAVWKPRRQVEITPEVASAVRGGAVVAVGVSGGKDSAATALVTFDYYLDEVGHRGLGMLIHSDLGPGGVAIVIAVATLWSAGQYARGKG